MIIQNLHAQPEMLDSGLHRSLRLRLPVDNWRHADKLNAVFVPAVEFGEACREYPIVFVPSNPSDPHQPGFAPVAVLGLARDENLYVAPDGRWTALHLPFALRMYPFALGRLEGDQFAVCVDRAWSGCSEVEGDALFDATGGQAELTRKAQEQLLNFEREVQRTQAVCQRLFELGLLRESRFEATRADGTSFAAEGFFIVDEQKFKDLPDAQVLELHRNGVLGLVVAHLLSMGVMRTLADRREARLAAAQADTAAAAPAKPH